MKLNFNLVMYKPNPNLDKYKTNENQSSKFNPSLGFKGFISVSLSPNFFGVHASFLLSKNCIVQ